MAPPLLTLQDIAITLGSQPLLASASLSVGAGDRVCLVGRNGSGKSTLLKIAAGMLQQDRGTRFVQPGATIRYLPQEPDLTGFANVLAYVEAGLGPNDDRHRGHYLLEQLGLTGEELPANLSGGEGRRAALARALAPSPDILLLDEPTNHLDLPAIAWLESELASLSSAIVVISHDRRLLESLSRSIVWLDRGQSRRLDRSFAHFEQWRDETLEQEEAERHKAVRKLVMEEDWLRYGVTARRKRNQKRLGGLIALRERTRQARGPQGGPRMAAAEGDISGKLVAVVEDVSLTYPGSTAPVIRELTTRVLRGDRIGIVGPNGAGKTTILGLLTGKLQPDSGSIRIGTALQLAELDQRRESLDPARTLVETLTGGEGDTVTVNGQKRHVMGYMKDFLFGPEQARTPVGVLSGGERARLVLAVALARPSNLLVLDEPTNDLDLETLELLQELLADYPGTVMLVSHDRDFLDRTATSVVNFEGDGRWIDYAGGYSDMLAQKGTPVRAREAAKKPRVGNGAAHVPAVAGKPRKLSFKDKHALETLPARIAELEKLIARERRFLSDASLYTRDPKRFRTATEALAQAEAELAQGEERWLELELLRTEMQSA